MQDSADLAGVATFKRRLKAARPSWSVSSPRAGTMRSAAKGRTPGPSRAVPRQARAGSAPAGRASTVNPCGPGPHPWLRQSMALLQIAGAVRVPSPMRRRLAVGIDLGTTNCCSPRCVAASPSPAGCAGTPDPPSAVRYHAERAETGESARAGRREDPYSTVISVKAPDGAQPGGSVKQLGEQLPTASARARSHMPLHRDRARVKKSPVEVSADILRELRQRAETTLGGELVGAVITVPAYFDDAQRQATKDAAPGRTERPAPAQRADRRRRGYGLDKGAEGLVAIYDLGGGTFDISIPAP